jgi:hypothetical protein
MKQLPLAVCNGHYWLPRLIQYPDSFEGAKFYFKDGTVGEYNSVVAIQDSPRHDA